MIEKPRLIFRVGISGHRPKRLLAAKADEGVLCSQIAVALQLVADTVRQVHQDEGAPYSGAEPVLRVISPLAEGADRLTARVAHQLGFELNVPLPFSQDRYLNDFVNAEENRDTRAEFKDMLRWATNVLELDSDPQKDTAYVAVGTTTVRQCDLLLVIWDGDKAAGPGGAPDVINEALRIELPTIWIDAHGSTKHAMGLAVVRDGVIVQQPWDADDVRARLRVLMSLPEVSQRSHAQTHGREATPRQCADQFFAEEPNQRPPRSFFATANRFFARGWQQDQEYRHLLASSDVLSSVAKQDRIHLTKDDDAFAHELINDVAAPDWTPEFRGLLRVIGHQLTPAFRDADRLAIRYANLHRDYMATGFLIYAPLAVLCAFLGFAFRDHIVVSMAFGLAEVWLIGTIWSGHRRNLKQRYHERWLDYRSIAEKLRHVLILAPLGRPSLDVQFPASLRASDLSSHWTNWYIRARLREVGLIAGHVTDPKYRAALRTLLWKWLVRGQIQYHARTAARMRTALRSVQGLRDVIFVGAAAAAVMHVAIAAAGVAYPAVHEWERQHEWLAMMLSAATVFFPSLVAALHGYSHQADFENTALRSQNELQRLLQVDDELRARPDASGLDLLRATSLTSESMLAELAEWWNDASTRPAEKP